MSPSTLRPESGGEGTRVLLFVGAHPDDETFALGGTLARYAAEDARVVYACATRGEAGVVDAELLSGSATVGDVRWAELDTAAACLGLERVIHLGYRDSGMDGSARAPGPGALTAAPLDEVAARVAAVIQDVRPGVVVTFGPDGGSGHPDHIAMHLATTRAFHAVLAAATGGRDHWPMKLYYVVPPRRRLQVLVVGLRLLGRDPRRSGRNGDVDLVAMARQRLPVHARLRIGRAATATKWQAARSHRSQLRMDLAARLLAALASGLTGSYELFTRAHPPADRRLRERDLFHGVDGRLRLP